jgi:tetratricopeptide (TPR) repeat protein
VHALAGRIEPAIAALERAVALDPELHVTKSNLAGLYASTGRSEEALALLLDAQHDAPGDADLLQKTAALRAELEVRTTPQDPARARQLAWRLATAPEEELRDGNRAVAIATQLCEATRFSDPFLLDTLAAALAEQGEFEQAAKYARRGLAFVEGARARAAGPSPELDRLAGELRGRLALYERGLPYRER